MKVISAGLDTNSVSTGTIIKDNYLSVISTDDKYSDNDTDQEDNSSSTKLPPPCIVRASAFLLTCKNIGLKRRNKQLMRACENRQACSPLIQLFFGFASDIDQTNINRDIRDGNWLSNIADKSALAKSLVKCLF